MIWKALRCPVCGAEVEKSENGKSLICKGSPTDKHHCYDFSARGYVNLALPSQSLSGDSRQAVVSRTRFLDGGYYAPVQKAVCDALEKYGGGLAVDAGCGEGYYTCAMADVCDAVVGFDLSKSGVDAAARRATREGRGNALFSVAGIYTMPLADGCADAVTSIFAPCAEQEFLRILKRGGVLIAVGAGEDHLLGLKRALYDEVYKNTDRADMPKELTLVDKTELHYEIELSDNQVIQDLFSMTPYYYRTSEKDLEKLSALNTLRTDVHVFIEVYQKH